MKTLFLVIGLSTLFTTFTQTLPQLRSVDCSRINIDPTYVLYANITGGTQYKFEVTNTTLGITDSLVSADRAFSISELPLISKYNCSYSIRVRINFGSGFGSYGPICVVTTAPLITQLRSVDCPRNLVWLNYPVYAAQLTADSWDFEVRLQSNSSITETVVGKPTREFKLTMTVSNTFQQYGTTYEVRCRTTQGGVVQPWGGWCQITTPVLIPPQITSGCGQTFEYLAYEYVTCTNIPTAVRYRWRLRIGTTFIDTVNTTTNQVRLCDFLDNLNQPTYNYNTTYNISCQVYDGVGWTSYGSACLVTTTSQPHTELLPSLNPCGTTVNMLNTPIYVYAVWSATQYIYEVVDLTGDDGTQTLTKTTKTFKLNELGQYSYGHTYQVRCKVTFKGITYDWGTACNIISPPPIISLRPADCPKTLTSMGQLFYANNTLTFDSPSGLDPIQTYQFKCNGVESSWQSSRGINLQGIGIPPTPNTSYTIYVRTTYDGIIQPWGLGCIITTPNAIMIDSTNIYPNPFTSTFKVSNVTVESIQITDLSGKIIETIMEPTGDLGGDLPTGIYYVIIEDKVYKIFKK